MRLFDTRGNALLLFENDSLRWALERRKTSSSRSRRREASGGWTWPEWVGEQPGSGPGLSSCLAQGLQLHSNEGAETAR
jgi:hypothetical protein